MKSKSQNIQWVEYKLSREGGSVGGWGGVRSPSRENVVKSKFSPQGSKPWSQRLESGLQLNKNRLSLV